MEALFEVSGISRQAFHQWRIRKNCPSKATTQDRVISIAKQVRAQYLPGSSARVVYTYIRNKHPKLNAELKGWGKHRFESLCLKNGLRIETKRFIPKTTVHGDFCYPNLVEGLKISDINTVWVSDICYIFGKNGRLIGYATTLIDIYSRLLLGLSFSNSMRAFETANTVLAQAANYRKLKCYKKLIFHSDGGKQFIETQFINTLRSLNIQSSMAENCYENAFAEAFNDTLKNHILFDLNLNSFSQLKKHEQFVKQTYNLNKPHSSLNGLTPVEFELNLLNLQPCQRTILEIKPKKNQMDQFKTVFL